MKPTFCCLSSVLLTGVAVALPARAATPQFQLSAVDAQTFHLVVYPSGQPAPPPSPFVVEDAKWPQAVTATNAMGSSVRVAGGALTLDARGNWQLKAPNNLTLSGENRGLCGQRGEGEVLKAVEKLMR